MIVVIMLIVFLFRCSLFIQFYYFKISVYHTTCNILAINKKTRCFACVYVCARKYFVQSKCLLNILYFKFTIFIV